MVKVSEQPDVTIAYQAKCPHCGDFSFISKVTGKTYICGTDYSREADRQIIERVNPETNEVEEIALLIAEKVKLYE